MNITYETQVVPFLEKFLRVRIDEERILKIEVFIKNLLEKKSTESHHLRDSGQEIKRWTTGFCGEAAIEKLLGIDVIDFNIGDSSDFHISDLSKHGLQVGIKTVEFGKFPVIFKNNFKSEIIVLKESRHDFIVCGVATPSMLNKYQSDSLILSPNLRSRGTKSGFYGFQYLLPIRTILDLKNL